jgi:O-antigen/teichoic acid export membrane protein
MNKDGNILKNTVSAISVVLFTAVVYFFLYKYLVATVGIKELGVWSLVVATISVGALANTALSESVIRFVAVYSAKNDWENVSKVLMTSCYLLGILLFVFLLLIYGISYYLLQFVVESKFLLLARSLLPFGLLAFWINGVASAFLSFFEGMRLAYIKNIVISVCIIIFFIGSRFMVPRVGLIGVVYAQILQAMVLFISSSVLVYIKSPYFSLKPLNPRSDLFKQIMAFSVNIQVVSVVTILFEPVTKYFLARYGNISFVGFYEMGNRLVLQARSLIISATQVLVPNLTIEAEKSLSALNVIYEKIFAVVIAFSTIMLAAIIIFLPYISIFWIGHFEPIFVLSTTILGIGWYINILASPVYFVNYATNSLKINLRGQLIMAALNPCLCWSLGMLYGSYFVIIGWVLSLVSGSLYTMISSHKKYGINNITLFKPEIKRLIWSLIFIAVAWLMYEALGDYYPVYMVFSLALILFISLSAITMFRDKNIGYVLSTIKLKFRQPQV